MIQLQALPAFTDNYIWLFHNHQHAWVVDPGEAAPVVQYLQQHQLTLAGMLLTHHHADHTGGVAELRALSQALVHGPAFEQLPEPVHRLSGGEQVQALGLTLQVLDVPGHTAGHIAYYTPNLSGAPALFCGDTLFSGGCGRLFEGTPVQMLASLDRLAELPEHTRVCCAHEYTLSNLRFAQAVEPDNQPLAEHTAHCEQLRQQGLPTVPSTMGLEKRINPFLRSREPSVRAAVQAHTPSAQDNTAVFAALREWKNGFR